MQTINVPTEHIRDIARLCDHYKKTLIYRGLYKHNELTPNVQQEQVLIRSNAERSACKYINYSLHTIPKLGVWPITSGFNSTHEEDLVQVLYLWWRITTHFNSVPGSPTCWKRLDEYSISWLIILALGIAQA
ncbi:hypothetical protein BDQ17DRAFT_1334450 [Cyathus striatus]|nr:hypothetical protein BDQ17DRAFT_1334450 [Cyathus striatus]